MQISYAWKPGGIFNKIPASGRPIWRLEWNDARKKITPGMKRRPEKNYAWNFILRLEFYIYIYDKYAESASNHNS